MILTLLSRCQKEGWNKPVVDTVSNVLTQSALASEERLQFRKGDGYSFAVTLSRVNKKNEHESVRLEPHPPYVRPTAIEARHWGATYALYRVSNVQYTMLPSRIDVGLVVLQRHPA